MMGEDCRSILETSNRFFFLPFSLLDSSFYISVRYTFSWLLYCDDDVDISRRYFFFSPIERFVSRGLTSSNLCALSISFRLCIGLTVYTYPPFFFSFLIHPFSKWNRHVVIYLFVFYSTDCGEGSREGRSWTPSQKESQLWKEEKLQVWHCCRFLCRNLIRKVSHLFSFSSCVLRLYSNSATYNKGNHWKIGWGKTTKWEWTMQPFVTADRFGTAAESHERYISFGSFLNKIKKKGTTYTAIGYCGAAVELIKCSR